MSATKFVTALNLETGELVNLPEVRSQFFRAAAISDDAVQSLRQSFKLACPHCDRNKGSPASLHFNFGAEKPDGSLKRIAGDNFSGQRSHIKTNPHALHTKGCNAVVLAEKNTAIDETKGYRLHINLGEIPERNPRNGQLIIRNEHGRIVILDDDLKGREAYELSSAAKLIPLLRSGQFERMRDSVALHGNHKIDWDDFFIHRQTSGDPDMRMRDFVQRRLANPHVHDLPALIDLKFEGTSVTHKTSNDGRSRDYKFPDITGVIHPAKGRSITVVPRIKVNNEHLFDMFDDLYQSHGEAFFLTSSNHIKIVQALYDPNVYVMSINVRDPALVAQASLHEIKQDAAANAARRAHIIAGTPTGPALGAAAA